MTSEPPWMEQLDRVHLVLVLHYLWYLHRGFPRMISRYLIWDALDCKLQSLAQPLTDRVASVCHA